MIGTADPRVSQRDELERFYDSAPVQIVRAPTVLTAAAEVQTGAMIALVPTDADAQQLVLTGTYAEPADQLHVTLLYLGEAVAWGPGNRKLLTGIIDEITQRYVPIATETFSVNVFNPGTDNFDTAIVLGVRGSDLLVALHETIASNVTDIFDDEVPAQHQPWVPHITLAYTDAIAEVMPEALEKLGPVVFDRVRVAFAGEVIDYPLIGTPMTAAADFVEAEHPRDTKGKFAKKASSAVKGLLNLADIWGQVDSGDFHDGYVLAESKDKYAGKKWRLVVQQNPDTGEFQISEQYQDIDNSWVEDDLFSDATDFTSQFNHDNVAKVGYEFHGVATPEPTPALAAPITGVQAGDFSQLKKISGPKGSNPGGIYEAPDGSRWYVKQQKSKAHALNEKQAADLYRAAGIDAPEVYLSSDGTQTASRIIPSGKTHLGNAVGMGKVGAIDKVREGFAVDALLANWDVAGLSYDNVIFDENGNPHRIDVGGSLEFRAQGTPKGSAFGTKVGEWDSLRNPQKNQQAAKIFEGMTPEQLSASVAHVQTLTPEKIKAIVGDGPLADKLIARREDLLKRAEKEGVLPSAPTEPFSDVNDAVDFEFASPQAKALGISDKELADMQAKVQMGTYVDELGVPLTGNATSKDVWTAVSSGAYAHGEVVAGYEDHFGNQHRLIVGISPDTGGNILHHEIKFPGVSTWALDSTLESQSDLEQANLKKFGIDVKSSSSVATDTSAMGADPVGIWKLVQDGTLPEGTTLASYVDSVGNTHRLAVGHDPISGNPVVVEQIKGENDTDWTHMSMFFYGHQFTDYVDSVNKNYGFGAPNSVTPKTNAPSAPTSSGFHVGAVKGSVEDKANKQLLFDKIDSGELKVGDVLGVNDPGPNLTKYRLVVAKNPKTGDLEIVKEVDAGANGDWKFYDRFVKPSSMGNVQLDKYGVTGEPQGQLKAPEGSHQALWQKMAAGEFGDQQVVGEFIDSQGLKHELRAGTKGATPGFVHVRKSAKVTGPEQIVAAYDNPDEFAAADLSKFKVPGTVKKAKSLPFVAKLTNAIIYGKYQDGEVIASYNDGSVRLVYKNNKILAQIKTTDPGAQWEDYATWGKAEAYKSVSGPSSIFKGGWYVGDKEAAGPSIGTQLVTSAPTPLPPKVTTPKIPVTVMHPVTTPSAPTATAGPPNIAAIDWITKSKIKKSFKNKDVKWHTAAPTMFEALVKAQQSNPDLSLSEILAIMDQTTATSTSPTPFTDKMKKYVQTAKGKQHLKDLGLPSDAMLKTGITSGTAKTGTSTPAPTYTGPLVPVPDVQVTPAGHGVFHEGSHTHQAPPGGFPFYSHSEMLKIQQEMKTDGGPWTSEQLSAIKSYTASSSSINGCLRNPQNCHHTTQTQIKNLEAAMRPLATGVRVKRGTGWEAFPGAGKVAASKGAPAAIAYIQAQEGRLLVEPGFLSTSAVKGFGGHLRWTIDVPAGAPAAYVEAVTSVKGEFELLLQHGLKYRIKKVEPPTASYKGTHIILEVIYP